MAMAAHLGDTEWLLRHGLHSKHNVCHANHRDGRAPLHQAAICGNENVVAAIIDNGIDPNSLDIYGNTPLMHAVIHSQEATVRTLLEKGADVNKRNSQGRAALHFAAWISDPTMIKIILDWPNQYLEINTFDNWYQSPLDRAIEVNHRQVIDLLLERGSSASLQLKIRKVAEQFNGQKIPYDWSQSTFYNACRDNRRDLVIKLIGQTPINIEEFYVLKEMIVKTIKDGEELAGSIDDAFAQQLSVFLGERESLDKLSATIKENPYLLELRDRLSG